MSKKQTMPGAGDLTITGPEVEQGSATWLELRRGVLTASTIGRLIAPRTLKPADNDTARAVVRTLIAEQVTGIITETVQSRDMLRGQLDEPLARDYYREATGATVEEIAFMRLDTDTYTLGYSPDGLVDDDGLLEIKSRRPQIQLQTILSDAVPMHNMAQLQTGMFVSGREWIDYVSFCSGMPLYVKRVEPDEKWWAVIREVAEAFKVQADKVAADYQTACEGLLPTEYVNHFADEEIF